jgi:6-pyruvoyltetrahydropterin/6-carboxytetrahydropterin synthase
VHGHNWSVRLTFACREPDANGFVVDFGDLKFIKRWIEDNLDHACLFNVDDPLRQTIVSAAPEAWKVLVVENCSCEGIARHLFGVFDPLIRAHTGGRAWLAGVEVEEDSKNSAAYRPDSA